MGSCIYLQTGSGGGIKMLISPIFSIYGQEVTNSQNLPFEDTANSVTHWTVFTNHCLWELQVVQNEPATAIISPAAPSSGVQSSRYPRKNIAHPLDLMTLWH